MLLLWEIIFASLMMRVLFAEVETFHTLMQLSSMAEKTMQGRFLMDVLLHDNLIINSLNNSCKERVWAVLS